MTEGIAPIEPPVPLGGDLAVGVPLVAMTGGEAVASAVLVVLAGIVEQAKLQGLSLNWSSLKLGVEVLPTLDPAFAVLPPLMVRARVHGRPL